MVIKIQESELFTKDPAIRFAQQHGVSPDLWRQLWKRYKLLSYEVPDLCDYYKMQVGYMPKSKNIRRWILRSEIYSMARPAVTKGAQAVNSTYFGQYEKEVLNELLKHMRFGGTQDTRSVL